MNRNKKAFLLFYTYLVLLFIPKSEKPQYRINNNYDKESSIPYASYSNEDVYISDTITINELCDEYSNDVFIIDDRDIINPNIEICYSHSIDSLKEKKEIISILQEYEKEFPSNWNRTYDSMITEWIIHNICYKCGIKINSSISVDLDNNDENIYSFKLIKKS